MKLPLIVSRLFRPLNEVNFLRGALMSNSNPPSIVMFSNPSNDVKEFKDGLYSSLPEAIIFNIPPIWCKLFSPLNEVKLFRLPFEALL